MQICFTLNHQPLSLDIEADLPLLTLLRERLGLTGTKRGCEIGECGVCSVILDGLLVHSCMLLAAQVDGCDLITIEGVRAADGSPSDLQQAFLDHGAVQCGFCTPGMVLAAEALLAAHARPTQDEILEGISGNLCRCTGYQQIAGAIAATAQSRREAAGEAKGRVQP